jgi:hypothetical protein
MEDLVYLHCIKEGSRFRVKITSPNYNNNANCQFPKDIRKEGYIYSVPREDIKFSRGPRGTFFYRIPKKNIKVVNEEVPSKYKDLRIFGDDDEDKTCVVCLDVDRELVYIPCGHFVSCKNCSTHIDKCPMCRTFIKDKVTLEELNSQ